MVYRFHYIVNARVLCGYAKGVCLKNIACLLLCQAAALYMIRTIGQFYLRTVIYTTLQPCFTLLTQTSQ